MTPSRDAPELSASSCGGRDDTCFVGMSPSCASAGPAWGSPAASEDGGGFPPVVPLNVGGVLFATSLETLQGGRFGDPEAPGPDGPGSMLSAMFSGRMATRRDPEGRFFIDRDGRHFHHILNYLRDGKFPVPMRPQEREELAREASFYGLEALAAHLRGGELRRPAAGEPRVGGTGGGGGVAVPAADAADLVMNRCLEDWPEFPTYAASVLERVLAAGGVAREGPGEQAGGLMPPPMSGSAVLDESSAATLQADLLASVQIELAHTTDTKAWRWSDRKTGVNSVLRAKLLRWHLQRLGYDCRILPLMDRRDVSAYVLQVDLPAPA